ncbi:hypothetical protein PVL29_012049 [Vitis rotundifolia]|uniref:DNA-3-methyladenine glycosylase I n=1 Tax=Vitis rotundifolia TaxID=103349 RepID=A0AA38ZQK7_VITRO|nr:hypothetical protein PVL29_012049 [Vitis rotundifolia]
MSRPPRLRPLNVAADSELRPVLVPAVNNVRPIDSRKPSAKPHRKAEKAPHVKANDEKVKLPVSLVDSSPPSPPVLDHRPLLRSDLPLNLSCSSSESSSSRASSGQSSTPIRRNHFSPKADRVEKTGGRPSVASDNCALQAKRRCAWVTPNTDPCYAAFHDEEWGVPVHNDKRHFELLVLSGALAELTWPAILKKRHIFREVFLEFDPIAVSKLNEKKIVTPGSPATLLVSELKLRSVIENARQICKIIGEFGSFDQYIWGFVNHKPMVGRFRYPRQVPVKTAKADVISKDLVKRGFRSVGPTVIYSFMQVAGITNDHLASCFRFQECVDAWENRDGLNIRVQGKQPENINDQGLTRAMGDLNLSSK